MEPLDEESRLRGRLHTLVGRMKKRQYEKEYISHIVMERNLTLSVGVVEAAIASHSSAVSTRNEMKRERLRELEGIAVREKEWDRLIVYIFAGF